MNDLRTPLSVANELRPVVLQLNRHLRRELAPLDVTAGQAALLHAIRTNPGIGVRTLADQEGVSPPRVTAALDRLESMGLVRRARSGSDRRRVELQVTDEGRRVLRSARSRRTAWLAARLARLTPADLDAIASAVPALRRLLTDRA
ncbi:MAG TPA: MarR family transcriptional regulator [Gaiellaceae bacterium]|jgi:DNA-binding MarR family transcriptional regulator|nr:MarR family transcriptional regulator [Gaiellaceae bacterium]